MRPSREFRAKSLDERFLRLSSRDESFGDLGFFGESREECQYAEEPVSMREPFFLSSLGPFGSSLGGIGAIRNSAAKLSKDFAADSIS